MPAPRQDPIFALVFAVWGALYTWSIVGYVTDQPAGCGILLCPDRIGQFLLWQLAAGAAAIPVFAMGRAATRDRPVRIVSAIPLALAGLTIVAIVCVMVWTRIAN